MSTTGGDVKSLPCGIVGKRSYPGLPWRGHHAQENNMPFIALKRVSVAANQLSPFYDFGFQTLEEFVFDKLRLRLALRTDNAHGTARVPRIASTRGARVSTRKMPTRQKYQSVTAVW
jgi:hypothetical protein